MSSNPMKRARVDGGELEFEVTDGPKGPQAGNVTRAA